MSFTTPVNRNSGSYIDENKSITSPFSMYLRHGKDPSMQELADFTFTDIYFPDGTLLKDITFAELSDTLWSLINKSV